jgi:alpha-galactosidase
MGFEMDPRELDDHEIAVLTEVTSWWKHNRDWMESADILLDSPDPAIIAEQQMPPSWRTFRRIRGQSRNIYANRPASAAPDKSGSARHVRRVLINRSSAPTLSRGTPH